MPEARVADLVAGARSGEVGGAAFRTRHLLSYSSWRRYQKPVLLRPSGARSSHWYIPRGSPARARMPSTYVMTARGLEPTMASGVPPIHRKGPALRGHA